MTTNIPVLPLAGATLARGFIGLTTQVTRFASAVVRSFRNRRDARILAGLDQHMLADIGLTRSDVSDAFSTSLWEDPTELLRERVQDRRLNRPVAAHASAGAWSSPASTGRRTIARRVKPSDRRQTAKQTADPPIGRVIRNAALIPSAAGSERPLAPPAGAFIFGFT